MKVITIGSSPQCDFVINRNTMPTLMDSITSQIKPVHCQIIQKDDESFRLIPFSEYIYINDCGINAPASKLYRINNEVIIDFEDNICIGIDLFWQQWFVGFGLNCGNCKYKKYSLPNDEWCTSCKKWHYNPAPYIFGYCWQFKENESFVKDKGYYNYVDCNDCSVSKDWCCECTFQIEPEPKNRSYKEHIEMYNERIMQYEASEK